MSKDFLEAKNLQWHFVEEVTNADLDYLQGHFKFHHLDYENIRNDSNISKIDSYKHYLFFVFHIPTLQKEADIVYGKELYMFLSKDELVTVSREPIPSVRDFFTRMKQNPKLRDSILDKGTAFLMYRILHDVFREATSVVAYLSKSVARLEVDIEKQHSKLITVDLGRTRRNILFHRHILDPQRHMLSSLHSLKKPFVPEFVLVYFDHLHDMLDTLWLTSDNLKLIADGLFDMNEALISHRTNEIIKLLTIISASLMVPTLISGFYGMNVPWLPHAHNARFVLMLFVVGFVGMMLIVHLIVRRHKS